MNDVSKVRKLSRLTDEEIEDASFRARDRAWVAVASHFHLLADSEGLTYEDLARRIGRKKTQVHRWLSSSCNMTMQSLGLLSEGLDMDLKILLGSREQSSTNRCHPSESAYIAYRVGKHFLSDRAVRQLPSSANVSRPGAVRKNYEVEETTH